MHSWKTFRSRHGLRAPLSRSDAAEIAVEDRDVK